MKELFEQRRQLQPDCLSINDRGRYVEFKANALNGWLLERSTTNLIRSWGEVSQADVERSQQWLALDERLRVEVGE